MISLTLISSFTLLQIVKLPVGEKFSELYLLGPQKMAQDLPFNIAPGQNYTVYLGVGNHLDTATYYCCIVKIRNQTEPAATQTNPSMLVSLYNYRTLLQNDANSTVPLCFFFSEVSFSNNQSILKTLIINDNKLSLDKSALFDQENSGYYYQIFVELWALNPVNRVFEYQNRFVYFWLNATSNV
ncbi:MAG: DUF1616 domain-containing protein [Candidatus Bathyarchaeia archaeon]